MCCQIPEKYSDIFIVSVIVCALLKNFVSVNYDMNDYLPEDARSTVALDRMEQEFEGGFRMPVS